MSSSPIHLPGGFIKVSLCESEQKILVVLDTEVLLALCEHPNHSVRKHPRNMMGSRVSWSFNAGNLSMLTTAAVQPELQASRKGGKPICISGHSLSSKTKTKKLTPKLQETWRNLRSLSLFFQLPLVEREHKEVCWPFIVPIDFHI